MFRNMSSIFQYSNILRSRGETVFTCGYQSNYQIRFGIPSLGRVTHAYHDHASISDMNAYLKLMEMPYNRSVPDTIIGLNTRPYHGSVPDTVGLMENPYRGSVPDTLGLTRPYNPSVPETIGLIILGSIEEMVMKEFEVFYDVAKRFAFLKKFEKDLFHRVDKNRFTKTYDDEYVIFTKILVS